MVFHVHSGSAHDTHLGRRSHRSMWKNPLHAGEMSREKSSGSPAHISAVCIRPTASTHLETLGSLQSLEPEEIMLCEGSPFSF